VTRKHHQPELPSQDIDDLSPPAVLSKDRGLQITVSLPAVVERTLDSEASQALEDIGQGFLQGVLVEAQRIAGSSSESLGLEISARDIHQAEGVERRRSTRKKSAWSYLRDLSLAGLGAGLSLLPTKMKWAVLLLLVFGVLFHLSDRQV